ncbi:unnamed protein product [Phyllotreta striolata]|uniref:DUF4758 domain-containing protein n=1 Tax=Phyllotreta striolata TaxID=444603 RepID=A0A9N9XNV4_PHYSR|nr:unnamed protein product [Phyllotreta striolata]
MDSKARSLLLACCLLFAANGAHSQGPVFVNPNDAAATLSSQTASPGDQGNYVTQTVYGFLDFTTTIGNTVMVFSPQSAAPVENKPASNEISPNNAIETKPLTTKKDQPIKPTKTESNKIDKSSEKKASSIVQLKSDPPRAISSISIKSTTIQQSSAPIIVSSIVEIVEGTTSSVSSIISASTKLAEPPIITSNKAPDSNIVTIIKSDNEPAPVLANNIGEPEYDFLSRQPSEVVEETYKVVNLKPSSKFLLKHRSATEAKKNGLATKRGGDAHPTGLVTKLGGTVVKDGTTTVIETSVIGTYISGKYAQVLQSTSRKIQPTQSLRILKTAAPSLGKGNKQRHVEATPLGETNEEPVALSADAAQNSIKSARKPSGPAGSAYKRFKNRHKESDVAVAAEEDNEPTPNYKKSQKNRSQSLPARNSKHHTTTQRPKQQKFGGGRNRKQTTPKPSVHSEEPPTSPSGKRYSSRRTSKSSKSPSESSTSSSFTRRGYKPKVQPSAVDSTSSSSSLYKFKLNRSPGRWQYKTTSRPRVTIRKQNSDAAANNNEVPSSPMPPPAPQEGPQSPINDVVTSQARSDDVDSLEGSESIASIIDDGSATGNKLDANPDPDEEREAALPAFPVETIKVEISAPSDFGDIYYEIATIKSPYTFQVGSVKNTRYVTVTSTFEKSLEHTADPMIKATEPLTENILATSSNYAKDNNFLDSSVATLPPLYLASDMVTPPLETFTETFNTTQTMLKTHILPVVRNGNDTSSSTLVQTYLITRLVTATKTLPPMEAYHFIPSKTLNEFNSHLDEAGSELHLELEFGDQNDQEEPVRKVTLPADLDLANIGSKFDISDVDKTKIEGHLKSKKPAKPVSNDLNHQQLQQPVSPEQLQQLALYRFLNPNAAQPQVITTSKPVIRIETLYETFILPVTQGHNTIQSTISKLKGTITKTDYEFGTSTIGPSFPQLNPLQHQLPQLPLQPQLPQLNPFLPQPQQQFAVTSSPVVQTTSVTQTNSKVLKLTFGAKTAHTTIYSTTVVPTVTTSYVTASVPVPGAGGYPGFYPAPFPGYPFVG